MRTARLTPGYVLIGAARSLSPAVDGGKILKFDTLAGSIATLPKATGSGIPFVLLVAVLATSNSHILKVGNAVDVFRGIILGTRVDVGNAVQGFAAAADSDTITLNRTTTGSVSLGEWLKVHDSAPGIWSVDGVLSATGAAFATPFSATV